MGENGGWDIFVSLTLICFLFSVTLGQNSTLNVPTEHPLKNLTRCKLSYVYPKVSLAFFFQIYIYIYIV